jgi:predicted Holliday junction resolvase-like endonuclease
MTGFAAWWEAEPWVVGLLASNVLMLGACFVLWRLHAAARRSAARLRFERRSDDVRGGRLAESLAPFVDGFPVDVHKAGTATVFLGQPVDYVHFDPDDGVTFVEIKSGGSQLSPRQRRLRELVEEGRVRWETYRVE